MADYLIEMFYDGDCPLCEREARMLARLDRDGRIRFTDIAAREFDDSGLEVSREEMMARIHARLADGRWIEGVEVFRELYSAVGFGRIVAVTRLPGISHALNAGYTLFARNRLRLTGRCEEGVCSTAVRGAK